MKWIEVNITTTAPCVESVEAVLLQNEITGWQEVDSAAVRFYISDSNADAAVLDKIKTELENKNDTQVSITQNQVEEDNWSNTWREFFKPLEVGKNIVIKPTWEVYENSEKLIFEIEPGNVFGTGQHESTRMCIEALEQYISPGDFLMDVGCGSGILAIIGLMLGASRCVAIDHNPDVAQAVCENAALNGISDDRFDVRIGNFLDNPQILLPPGNRQYDCITANIVADVIIGLLPMIDEINCLKPNGLLITSGIIKDRLDGVLSAFGKTNYSVIKVAQLGEWACVIARF